MLFLVVLFVILSRAFLWVWLVQRHFLSFLWFVAYSFGPETLQMICRQFLMNAWTLWVMGLETRHVRFHTTARTSRMRWIFWALCLCRFASLPDCSHPRHCGFTHPTVGIRFCSSACCYTAFEVAEAVDQLDFMIVNLYFTSAGVVYFQHLRCCDVYLKFDSAPPRLGYWPFLGCRRVCAIVAKCHQQTPNSRVAVWDSIRCLFSSGEKSREGSLTAIR